MYLLITLSANNTFPGLLCLILILATAVLWLLFDVYLFPCCKHTSQRLFWHCRGLFLFFPFYLRGKAHVLSVWLYGISQTAHTHVTGPDQDRVSLTIPRGSPSGPSHFFKNTTTWLLTWDSNLKMLEYWVSDQGPIAKAVPLPAHGATNSFCHLPGPLVCVFIFKVCFL